MGRHPGVRVMHHDLPQSSLISHSGGGDRFANREASVGRVRCSTDVERVQQDQPIIYILHGVPLITFTAATASSVYACCRVVVCFQFLVPEVPVAVARFASVCGSCVGETRVCALPRSCWRQWRDQGYLYLQYKEHERELRLLRGQGVRLTARAS